MAKWANATGQALSSATWLEVHHRAKLSERTRFARSLVSYQPRKLVDLGCGTGLWLDTIDKILPRECKFIGIDSDPGSLALAQARASSWGREVEFIHCDLVRDFHRVPSADLMLAFNLLPYIPNALAILKHFREKRKVGRLVIRQYDGGTMRIGPLPSNDRQAIETSLHTTIRERSEPSHYDIDRAYQLAHASGLQIEKLNFELTQRHAPFSPEFADYLAGTVEWLKERLADDARMLFEQDLPPGAGPAPLYFLQADLIAVLSSTT